MSAKALTKKYGSRAMGLSKRVKAGQVVSKAAKGRRFPSKRDMDRMEYDEWEKTQPFIPRIFEGKK